VGQTGDTGAAGTNGPTSNKFNMTTLTGCPCTIADTSTALYYLVPNVASSFTNVTLPHANVAGKMVVLIAMNGVSSSGVQAVAPSGDTLVSNDSPAGQGSTKVIALSNGSGDWIILSAAVIQ
jgi:hypothetical protein